MFRSLISGGEKRRFVNVNHYIWKKIAAKLRHIEKGDDMYIRKNGKKAVLMRPVYDREEKRCFDHPVAKMLLDKPFMTPEIESLLKPSELISVHEWIANRYAELAQLETIETIVSAAVQMNKIATAIKKKSPSFKRYSLSTRINTHLYLLKLSK